MFPEIGSDVCRLEVQSKVCVCETLIGGAGLEEVDSRLMFVRRPGPKGFFNMDPGAVNLSQPVLPPSVIAPQGAELEHPQISADSGAPSLQQESTSLLGI